MPRITPDSPAAIKNNIVVRQNFFGPIAIDASNPRGQSGASWARNAGNSGSALWTGRSGSAEGNFKAWFVTSLARRELPALLAQRGKSARKAHPASSRSVMPSDRSPGLLNGGAFAAARMNRLAAIEPVLVPPNADRGPRFDMQFFRNVFHVFLDGARATPENLSDLAVALAGSDPFDDFELAFGEGTRPLGIRRGALVYFGCLAVPGGHGNAVFS